MSTATEKKMRYDFRVGDYVEFKKGLTAFVEGHKAGDKFEIVKVVNKNFGKQILHVRNKNNQITVCTSFYFKPIIRNPASADFLEKISL